MLLDGGGHVPRLVLLSPPGGTAAFVGVGSFQRCWGPWGLPSLPPSHWENLEVGAGLVPQPGRLLGPWLPGSGDTDALNLAEKVLRAHVSLQVNCNGFTIEDEELSHLGSAIFPE